MAVVVVVADCSRKTEPRSSRTSAGRRLVHRVGGLWRKDPQWTSVRVGCAGSGRLPASAPSCHSSPCAPAFAQPRSLRVPRLRAVLPLPPESHPSTSSVLLRLRPQGDLGLTPHPPNTQTHPPPPPCPCLYRLCCVLRSSSSFLSQRSACPAPPPKLSPLPPAAILAGVQMFAWLCACRSLLPRGADARRPVSANACTDHAFEMAANHPCHFIGCQPSGPGHFSSLAACL